MQVELAAAWPNSIQLGFFTYAIILFRSSQEKYIYWIRALCLKQKKKNYKITKMIVLLVLVHIMKHSVKYNS